MLCPKCRHQNLNDAVFCAVCGSPLGAAPVEPQSPAAPHAIPAAAPQPAYPLMRGTDLDAADAARKYAQGKNPFIAMLVSFAFPAGGQLYNGDFKKAAAIWLAFIGCIFIASTGVGTPPAFFLSLLIWAWAIFDAYGVAKREKVVW